MWSSWPLAIHDKSNFASNNVQTGPKRERRKEGKKEGRKGGIKEKNEGPEGLWVKGKEGGK